jgi:hypothetical protein
MHPIYSTECLLRLEKPSSVSGAGDGPHLVAFGFGRDFQKAVGGEFAIGQCQGRTLGQSIDIRTGPEFGCNRFELDPSAVI